MLWTRSGSLGECERRRRLESSFAADGRHVSRSRCYNDVLTDTERDVDLERVVAGLSHCQCLLAATERAQHAQMGWNLLYQYP